MRLLALCLFAFYLKPLAYAQGFDKWVLAITYMNGFCSLNPDKPECKKVFTKPEMGLHGLWPNRNDDPAHLFVYCGIPRSSLPEDWCDARFGVKPKMSPIIFRQLQATMPGVQSCLYNHEWYAHGTCSRMSVNDYFSRSTMLTYIFFKHAKTFRALMNARFEKPLTKQQIRSALSSDFGIPILKSLSLQCQGQKLIEIHISLNSKTAFSFPAVSSFEQSGEPETCPDLINI